jgi:hypothetical protein
MRSSIIATLACFMLLGVVRNAAADGVVQSASKDAAKGAVKGVQQELNTGTMIEGAKQVTKGMVDGMSAAVPTVTSQLVKQSNINRKQIGAVTRTVTSSAVSGVMTSGTQEIQEALGKRGDGPLAETLAATSERVTAATVRGIIAEARMDPATAEALAAATVRGALSQVQFRIPVWSYMVAFMLGCFSTLVCGVGLMVLYMLFQRRRPAEVVAPVNAPALHTRPVFTPG